MNVEGDASRAERAKFALGGAATSIDAGELPWSYGEDRITAMVRDPDSAYLYWEITDEGLAAARARLGTAGQHGWCNLRVYDTSGRDFDGTNANDYFDIRVDRLDREYFVMIRRPSSTMHVEIGVKSHEGYFQPIARSGRADFPRSSPSADTRLEWTTVTSGDLPPCVTPCRSRYAGPEPSLPGREGAGYFDVWRAAYVPSMPEDHATDEHRSWTTSATRTRTFEHRAHIERWWHLDEWRVDWRTGLRFFRWEHHDPNRVVVELLGEEPAHFAIEGGEMVAYGPWKYTIRSIELASGRRTLATWSVRWIRASTPMIERWESIAERHVLSGYEREHVAAGASEQQRLLERGASEIWRLGASERLWIGASEWMGASERLGGSEGLGASGRLGASEQHGRSVGASGERWAVRTEGE